jgi:peroxiredoxin
MMITMEAQHMFTSSQKRLQELESRFIELENKLSDTPEREAISILHAILQESVRAGSSYLSGNGGSQNPGITLEDVVNLYKQAPGMEGEAQNTGLRVGTKAPDFSLSDANGKLIHLSEFRGKNVVLVFYPLDWSPACSDQLNLYQSELAEFERANAQLIGISMDSIYSHGAWAAVRGLTFPLLADFHPKGQVARLYGVMRDSHGFSERALYIIDANGYIRYAHISPKLNHIPDIYELLNQLEQLEPSAAGAVVK